MDIFCLVVWILNLIITVDQAINNKPISPVVTICAILVCIVFYLSKIVGDIHA